MLAHMAGLFQKNKMNDHHHHDSHMNVCPNLQAEDINNDYSFHITNIINIDIKAHGISDSNRQLGLFTGISTVLACKN
jgi:hypothetical protein